MFVPRKAKEKTIWTRNKPSELRATRHGYTPPPPRTRARPGESAERERSGPWRSCGGAGGAAPSPPRSPSRPPSRPAPWLPVARSPLLAAPRRAGPLPRPRPSPAGPAPVPVPQSQCQCLPVCLLCRAARVPASASASAQFVGSVQFSQSVQCSQSVQGARGDQTSCDPAVQLLAAQRSSAPRAEWRSQFTSQPRLG